MAALGTVEKRHHRSNMAMPSSTPGTKGSWVSQGDGSKPMNLPMSKSPSAFEDAAPFDRASRYLWSTGAPSGCSISNEEKEDQPMHQLGLAEATLISSIRAPCKSPGCPPAVWTRRGHATRAKLFWASPTAARSPRTSGGAEAVQLCSSSSCWRRACWRHPGGTCWRRCLLHRTS